MDISEDSSLNTWCKDDIVTIISWVAIGRRKIREMELIVEHNRLFMRQVTFYNLIFSSASGTVGVATIENASIPNETRFWCNLAVVLASFLITMLTGALKICQVQENLELAIKYKQDWISFAAEIASEIQLPDKYRRESQFVINKNRAKYLELLKLDIEVPKSVAAEMELMITREQENIKQNGHRGKKDSSSLVDILANIIDFEHMKLMYYEDEADGDTNSSKNNLEFENEAELRYKLLRSEVTTPSTKKLATKVDNTAKTSTQLQPISNTNAFEPQQYKPQTKEERNAMQRNMITRFARSAQYDDSDDEQLKQESKYDSDEEEEDSDIENPRRTSYK